MINWRGFYDKLMPADHAHQRFFGLHVVHVVNLSGLPEIRRRW